MGRGVLAGVLVASLLAGCAAGDVDAVGTLDDSVRRALAYDPPAAYEVDLEVTCFCPANRFTVTVRDGEVVERTALDDAGEPLDLPAPPAFAASVQDIQRRLREVATGDGVVTALELGGGGLPVVVGLDPAPDVVDDEVTYRVLDLRPST